MTGRGDGQILLCQDEGGCYLEQYIFEIVLRYHMGFMHRMGLLPAAYLKARFERTVSQYSYVA